MGRHLSLILCLARPIVGNDPLWSTLEKLCPSAKKEPINTDDDDMKRENK